MRRSPTTNIYRSSSKVIRLLLRLILRNYSGSYARLLNQLGFQNKRELRIEKINEPSINKVRIDGKWKKSSKNKFQSSPKDQNDKYSKRPAKKIVIAIEC